MHDVIIVGSGPMGSYAAYRLAGMGHDVLVLERKPGIRGKVCCTGIIGQECVRAFALRDVILREVNSARLFSPSGNQIRLWREEPQASVVDRTALDITLSKMAQGKGAQYLLDATVSRIVIEPDRVRVTESRHGSVSARAVIIASGFGPRLEEPLGLGRIDDFVSGVQVEVETAGLDEVEVYLGNQVAPGFFAWLVPTTKQQARVGLLSRHRPALFLRKLLASLAAQGKIAHAEVEISHGVIPLKPLPRTSGERLLVVGDAAGQVKPTSGGGIYYGLLCTDIAVETLHPALDDDDLSARRLASYEQRWRRKLARELKIGYWARKLFERLSDKQIERIFDIITTQGIADALLKADDLSFDWHSQAIFRLLGHQLIAKSIDLMKIPFRTGLD